MPVDPQCQAILDGAAARGSVFDARTPAEARRTYDAGTPVFAPRTPPLKLVTDITVPGPAGPGPAGAVPVRVYTPKGHDGPLPVLVYFHGGGWIFGNLESHDALCRLIAHEGACVVASVDYRLAPEHRFPAGVEDCFAVTRWVAVNAGEIGGDGARLAVAGDSAGGNLAAVIAQLARDAGGPKIAFQWLIYPAVDFTADTDSLRDNAEGYLLTKTAIDWTTAQYLNGAADARDPRASPLLAKSLAGLPSALVQTAEFDPLRDEGKAYADRLRAAGVPVAYTCYDGMIHGFLRMGALVDRAFDGVREGAAALRRAFAA